MRTEQPAVLADALSEPRAYPDSPAAVSHLETHISHVYLTGTHAYKVKKPLDLGFLDFSTLEKRRRCCQDELRINRRLAPDLYLDVVPITGTAAAPSVEGKGEAIEYAVKMREFPQTGVLTEVLARGALTPDIIDDIALQVARFHTGLPPADADTTFGTPDSIMLPAQQNFAQLAPLLTDPADRAMLETLASWTEAQHAALAERLTQRKRDGFIRECHGDLHLGNIVLIDAGVRIFDAIEFNAQLRWIDVISEVAFLVMDLVQRGRADLGWRFLNRYLEHTGDYAGVRVLRYYLVYRALVRAKVAAIRAAQADVAAAQRQALEAKCRKHLKVAHDFASHVSAALVIHHGVSGSGKTTASQTILETVGAVRVRSDVERKRLHGMAAIQHSGAAVGKGLYDPASTQATYARLADAAEDIVHGGFVALVDATFTRRTDRDAFHALAMRLQVPFGIAEFTASPTTLRARVVRREQEGTDASEAGIAVLEHQLRTCEPLTADEQTFTTRFDTDQMDVDRIQHQSRLMLARLLA